MALLPLFPLQVVLFPAMTLPLHIFEPRYRQMIAECMATRSPFGILLENEGERAEVGCSAVIAREVKRFPDGQMDILVEGRERFRVLSTREDLAYLRGEVEWLQDPPQELDAARARALELYRRTYHAHGEGLPPSLVEEAPLMSFAIARSSLLDLTNRQRLLETDGEATRLESLGRALEELEPLVRKVGGNGHVAGETG